jgi:DNA-binding protein H-NS
MKRYMKLIEEEVSSREKEQRQLQLEIEERRRKLEQLQDQSDALDSLRAEHFKLLEIKAAVST